MLELNVREWPGDPARPALALHCMMGTASYWGPIAADLNGLVHLRAPDLPGHGRSHIPEPVPEDFHDYSARLIRPLLPETPVDLIGHSFGATLAIRLAIEHPEAVRTLTLIEPTFFAADPNRFYQADFPELEEPGDADHDKSLALFLKVWGGSKLQDLTPERLDIARRQLRYAQGVRQVMVDDEIGLLAPGRVETLTMPVLFITGSHTDRSIHAIVDALAARLPDVGRADVPKAGHMVPITHPHETAGLIRTNLERA